MQQVASTAMSLRTVMSTDINLLPVKRQAFDVGIDDVGLELKNGYRQQQLKTAIAASLQQLAFPIRPCFFWVRKD
ncbi:Os02g0217732 [Oryza sativa Japonica Group]|uniref:Os02g0217732 protein n=2 Tax=Oryza sativa subsp. japonica TaxID=39947 RepID=Q6Z6L7_ORYSJ|nr:hypothetical protein [Oryza sativa Japonica Group]BAS77667.1 Os02g0217732 [Oryza sativa Japonica Group]